MSSCPPTRSGSRRWRVVGVPGAAALLVLAVVSNLLGAPAAAAAPPLVVVPGGGPRQDGSAVSLVAYDRATGDRRWTGGNEQISFVTPQLATIGGREVVLTVNEASVAGHDPGDGAELWRRTAWPASVLNLTADDANVYVNYASGQFGAQAVADGSTRWLFEQREAFFYPPRLGDGVLYASGAEGLAAIRTR